MRCFLWHHQFPLLLFFIIVCCSYSTHSSPFTSTTKTHNCSHTESAALLHFKQAFLISTSASSPSHTDDYCETSYPKTESWKENTDCCIWEGISCSSLTGHVIGLNLSCSQLYGKFPPNSTLFHLNHLKMLDLSGNDFRQSRIPAEFGQFTNLTHLDLSSSGFSGQVPSEISHLSKLVSLHLSPFLDYGSLLKLKLETSTVKRLVQNFSEIRELSFRGINMSSVDAGILMNLSSSLTSLDLSLCELKGKIPDSFFRRPNLRMVTFKNFLPWMLQFFSKQDQLTVHLPKSNWTSALEHLNLQDIVLSGQLPDSIRELQSLESLSLVDCNLFGSIPTWIANLSHLKHLSRSSNYLTGQIPSSFANLTQLGGLYLYDNLLNGTIPYWVFNLSFLREISLGKNRLTGHINEFRSKSVSSIFLNDNMLQGQIPNSIFELVNLRALGLSSNNFSGIVEFHKFSKSKSMEILDLSNNSLSLIIDNFFNYTFPKLWWLDLSSCSLSDFPNFLRESNDLKRLDISKNKISGPIPKWMWDVGKDSLSAIVLSYNSLTGPIQIPWQNLEILDLRSNLLEGLIPVPPSGTRFFSISNNNFTGKVSSLFCSLNSLEILDLSHSNLRGKIPSCLFNSSKLLVLDLQSNNFHGTIPKTFMKGCALTMLNLGGNQLQGLMPQSLANCRKLEALDIGNNYINDTFPHWLASLLDLQVLILRSNKFHGFVNDSKESGRQLFPKLQVLDLSSNGFVGFLPTWCLENLKTVASVNQDKGVPKYMQVLAKSSSYLSMYRYTSSYSYSVILNIKGIFLQMERVLTMFSSIDLSNNNFEGVIPEVIGKLSSLKGLNLSHNNLGGHIPRSIGNLTNLEWLDLSSNKLVGGIPGELINLTSLEVLNLSNNQLVGPIPGGKQFDTFENSSFEGNTGLCGFQLSKTCHETEKQNQEAPPLSSSSEPESGFGIGWKVVLLGYGCGLIFGAAGGRLVFLTGKPKWIVNVADGKRHQRARWRRRRRRN